MRQSTFTLLLAVLAFAGVVAIGLGRPSRAEDAEKRYIAYINITGEGATAKAWYRGAPPAGVPVQEALDHFAEQGYRVASVSPSQRPIVTTVVSDTSTSVPDRNEEEQFFIVLLEK